MGVGSIRGRSRAGGIREERIITANWNKQTQHFRTWKYLEIGCVVNI